MAQIWLHIIIITFNLYFEELKQISKSHVKLRWCHS